jgi:hypothetical protein
LKLEPVKKEAAEAWKIEMDGNGFVNLFSTRTKRYIGCNEEGKVVLKPEATENNEEPYSWILRVTPDGLFQFISWDNSRLLAHDCDGSIMTMQLTDVSDTTMTLWKLDPCLPKDSSSARMKALKTIGAAVAVAAIAPSLRW